MARTVFWSWQSDQPSRETRNVIRDALTAVIGSVAAEFDEAERPEIDHDTKDLPGSPDIVAAILGKIDAAAVFVADVTPIAISAGGKQVANPNVLIELGYAKRALGLDRVIQVWNTALTGAKPEDLPFDMRQKRAPLSYELPVGASTDDLRRVRTQLQDRLTTAIRAALKVAPGTPAPLLPWRPSIEGDQSIWIAPGTPIRLNEGWGSGTKTFIAGGRWYVRILPTTFDPDILDTGVHGPVVGFYGGFSWGHATGGLMTYSGSVRADVPPELDAASMWFRDTGEIWAFQTRVGGEYQGRQVFHGDHVPEKWAETLADGLKKLADHGGGAPFYVRLGVTGLDGLCWPDVQSYGGEPPVALEPAFEVEFTARDHQPAIWREPFVSAWNGLRRVFSMPSPDPALLDKTIATAIR